MENIKCIIIFLLCFFSCREVRLTPEAVSVSLLVNGSIVFVLLVCCVCLFLCLFLLGKGRGEGEEEGGGEDAKNGGC